MDNIKSPTPDVNGREMFNPFRKLRQLLGIRESYTQPYGDGLGQLMRGEFGQIELYDEYNTFPELQKYFNVAKEGNQIKELHIKKEEEQEYLNAKRKLNLPRSYYLTPNTTS